MKRDCELCAGTGWKDVVVDGRHYAQRCDHGAAKPPQSVAEIFQQHASLERLIKGDALLEAILSRADFMIGRVIAGRRGRKNAITIAEIGEYLWPEEWRRSQTQRESITRSIKESVARLRLTANAPIAASKEKPYGYFIPATADEADEYAERMFSEGIKLIRICRIFRPDRDWIQELRGQLTLEEVRDK